MRRRAFLSAAAAALIAKPGGAAADPGGPDPTPANAPPSGPLPASAVVAAVAIPDPDADLAPQIDAALASIGGWEAVAGPRDRVAIKLNCLAGARLAPHPKLVDAVVRGLASAGVPRGEIVVFDRTSSELARAGYHERREPGDVRFFGTDALAGGGYGETILEHRSIGSFFTRILVDHATVLINVGVCKDHDLSGISAGLKNLYGLIHNPNRYHANGCDPFVADLADHPAVRAKLRLTVVDAITAQCHGGPAYNPAHTFHPGRVLLTRDPLAADVIARDWIEAERARRGLPTLAAEKRAPAWIDTAARLGIGVGDPARIRLLEVSG